MGEFCRHLRGVGQTMKRLLLYSSPECTLCVPVKELLQQVAVEKSIALDIVDIKNDRQAFRRYKFDIPVVFYGDCEIARHRLDRATLLAALKEKD